MITRTLQIITANSPNIICFYAVSALLIWITAGQASVLDRCGFPLETTGAFSERAFAIETPEGRIEGTLATPQHETPKALTLMLHGYTGARNENGGMFRRTAHVFARHGIATLRIDFLGSGKSEGAWADTRFSTQARDATRAATALQKTFDDDLSLSVLGYSQGGLVALRTAASQFAFDRVALWNPVMDPMATYGIIFGQDTILDAAQSYQKNRAGSIVGETRLKPGFFAELVEEKPMSYAAATSSPMMIVTGARDPLVKQGDRLAAQIAESRLAQTVLLHLDTGHDLGALRDPDVLHHVMGCTAGFLLGLAR